MKKYLILILLLNSYNIYSQISNIRIYSGYGTNIDKSSNVNIFNYSIGVIKRCKTNKDWYLFYKQPKIGFFLTHFNYSKINNNSYSLYPAIIFKGNTKLSYEVIIGAGLTYFDSLKFEYSKYLSTKLNWLFITKVNLIYYTKYFNFLAGIDLNHNSNSSIKFPNNGLNIFTYFVGLECNINKKYLYTNNYKIKYNKIYHKKYPFNIELEFGIGPTYFMNNKNNFIFKENELIYNTVINISKRFSFFKPKIGYKAVFYKNSFNNDRFKNFKSTKKINNFLYIGNDFIFGNFNITMNLGYLLQNENILLPYYNNEYTIIKYHLHEQIGILYNIYNFGIGLRLNARCDSSDYMELYLRYNIKLF